MVSLSSFGQSVSDPHGAARVEQQVARFDVAVQDALIMRVLQTLRDLNADVGHGLPVRGLFRLRLRGRFRLTRQHNGAGERERVGQTAGGR